MRIIFALILIIIFGGAWGILIGITLEPPLSIIYLILGGGLIGGLIVVLIGKR
jgi:hypothetical protein